MSNFNLSEIKKNALLQMAGKRLGTDPAKLKEKIESGEVSDLVNSLSAQQKEQLSGLLQNPQALSALLGSEQVQSLLKSLGGK